MVVVTVKDIKPQIMALIQDAEKLIANYIYLVDVYLHVEQDGNITLNRTTLRNILTGYNDMLKHPTDPAGGVYNKIHGIIGTLSDT